jgi:hypothetical protein
VCATAIKAGASLPPDFLTCRQNFSLIKQFFLAAAAQAGLLANGVHRSTASPRSRGTRTPPRREWRAPRGANRKCLARSAARQKDWVEVASKLGAPVMRVYSGARIPEGHTFDQVLEWMIPNLRECAEYAGRHGVILVLQNHDDFVKTADQAIRIINAVDAEWFGSVLDVGPRPYTQREIKRAKRSRRGAARAGPSAGSRARSTPPLSASGNCACRRATAAADR